MRWMRLLSLLGCLPAAVVAAGCDPKSNFVTDDRLANGLVIILPGIEGESELNRNIRRGLLASGVDRALPIRSWGRPIPLAGVLINQMDFLGNRLAGIGVANVITDYQDSHPGRPVYVIGHSGGGGVAVFTAEALPKDRQIDGLILLSASISSAYDLTKALGRCRNGIANFHNPDDAGLLGIGTTIVGTVDGTHGPSAGLIGFDPPAERDKEEKKLAYEKLYQVRLDAGMVGDGDPHSSSTHVPFVATYVAPWVLADTWPAGPALAREYAPPQAKAKADAARTETKPGPADQPKAQPTSAPGEPVSAEPAATQPTTKLDASPTSKPKPRPRRGTPREKREPTTRPKELAAIRPWL